MRPKLILVAAEHNDAAQTIRQAMGMDYQVDVAIDYDSCLDKFQHKKYEFTFVDVDFLHRNSSSLEKVDFEKALRPFWRIFPSAQIIAMAKPDKITEAVRAVKAGAGNYLIYPLIIDEIKHVTHSLLESVLLQSELDYLRDQFWQTDSLELVRTYNPQMRQVFEKVKLVAPTKSTILLSGDTGTGKTLIAKLIHQHSQRNNKRFIAIHCGTIPDSLIESEMFGHEKGAFTGAVRRKYGKFEIAKGGTIFLDEIGTITQAAQIKLLQVLQEKTFQRVGGEATIQADVRIIAASNEDLHQMVAQAAFRRDLLYRLNVFPIHIPPLAERKEDIPLLIEVFLKKLNREYSKEITAIEPELIKALSSYDWPGNVRELENIIERAFIIENSNYLTRDSFPGFFEADCSALSQEVDTSLTLAMTKKKALEEIEQKYLIEMLKLHKGSIKKTAANAGISTRQLHKLMTKHGLKKERYK